MGKYSRPPESKDTIAKIKLEIAKIAKAQARAGNS